MSPSFRHIGPVTVNSKGVEVAMEKRPAVWFRNVAITAGVLALIMVGAMEGLQEAHLPLWLHIPLTLIVLTCLGGGALAAGVAYCEFRGRTPKAQ